MFAFQHIQPKARIQPQKGRKGNRSTSESSVSTHSAKGQDTAQEKAERPKIQPRERQERPEFS